MLVKTAQDAPERHTRKTIQTAAPQKVHQHGLDLVIGMMRGHHGLHIAGSRQSKQKAVARASGCFFNPAPPSLRELAHLRLSNCKGQFPLPAQSFDKLSVPGGGGTQEMVKMSDKDIRPDSFERMQQSDAVRPTGNTYQQRAFRVPVAFGLQRFENNLGQHAEIIAFEPMSQATLLRSL